MWYNLQIFIQVTFSTLSGDLVVTKNNELLEMEFPAYKLEKVPVTEAIIDAIGKAPDSVSRSFAPKLNVIEDPVCGSGHCHIAPYWSEKLKKENIVAYQASKRGGTLYCRISGNKVFLAGKAALFSECELYI